VPEVLWGYVSMTSAKEGPVREKPRYPGIRVTANGNQLVSYHTETRITDAGIFYPITPSTEGGELYQQAYA
jgi:pyruvate-ferredoxin/flavodoxin oxidoreductase